MKYIIKKNTKNHVEATLALKLLDREKDWMVTFEEIKPDLSAEQRKIMWQWNNIVAKETGCSANYIHGLSKREILLPYRLSIDKYSDEAAYVKRMIEDLGSEGFKIKASFGLIRSSDLTQKEMSEYLDMYRIYWTMNSNAQLLDGEEYAQLKAQTN